MNMQIQIQNLADCNETEDYYNNYIYNYIYMCVCVCVCGACMSMCEC